MSVLPLANLRILTLFMAGFLVIPGFAQKKTVDSLLRVLDVVGEREKIGVYLKLSSEVNIAKPTKAIYYAKEALLLARKFKDEAQRGNALHAMGTAYIFFHDYAESETYLDSALTIRQKLNDTLGIAKTLNNLGLSHFNHGEYRRAVEYYTESIKYRQMTKDKKGLVNTLMSLGHSHRSLGEFQIAYGYFMDGLKVAEGEQDEDLTATAYINIAILFSDQKKYDEALDFQLKSLEIKQRTGSKKSIASAMSNVGTIYMNMKKYSEALHYLLQSMKIREDINDKKGIATTANNIAELFLETNDLKKAEEYCQRSLKIRTDVNDRAGIASSLINLAKIYEALGRIQDAINTLEKSREILELLESKTILVSNYKSLARLYAQQQNFHRAFLYQEKYSDLNDTLFQENTFRQMAELQTKYDTDKQKQEIELLNKENELQDQRNQKVVYLLIAIVIGSIIIGFTLYNRYKLKQRANKKLELAYQEIETKNKDITDSIVYAKRIQDAILPTPEQIKKILPGCFVLFQPKDIVSGDFYWIDKQAEKTLFAAVDCTGHGVPGAFLSMVGSSLLNQTIHERNITRPGAILDDLNHSLRETLLKEQEGQEVKDGMDIALCSLDQKTGVIEFGAAFNPLFYLRKIEGGYEFQEIKADKIPIGLTVENESRNFSTHTLQLHPGDCVYIFTDGYADQFGGESGKKFKYKRFKELLLQIAPLDVEEQKKEIEKVFKDWKGQFEQVDDVLIIGYKR
jgi:serine phosphatase RsbU (regulator of sigma subunit)/uncharacterized protein HemY